MTLGPTRTRPCLRVSDLVGVACERIEVRADADGVCAEAEALVRLRPDGLERLPDRLDFGLELLSFGVDTPITVLEPRAPSLSSGFWFFRRLTFR